MKAACIQYNLEWENPSANFSKVETLIQSAKKQGASLICLPELFSSGVTLNSSLFAEDENGSTNQFLSKQAKKHKIYLVGSFIEKVVDSLPKNTLVVYDPKGKQIAKYSKIHVFTYGNEKTAYAPGDKLVTFETEGFTIAPIICYDLRFPEQFRAYVQRYGVNLFVIIANWPNPRYEHWIALLKARAIENQAYMIATNRIGTSPSDSFFGSSVIISPKGEILQDAGQDETVLTGEINLKEVIGWRNTFPALKDSVNF